MSEQFAILNPAGDLHLSVEAIAALRLRPGARVLIRIEEDRVTLLASTESMDSTAELQRMRREDDEHFDRKFQL